MNVFGQSERSWRKGRKRAVSPIIATILLVAITVVLAAVLYVLISGLTHGTGSAPIGSAFAAGNAVGSNTVGSASSAPTACPTTSTATLGPLLKSGEWTYTLSVESSSVNFGQLGMEVKTSGGAIATASTSAAGFYVLNTAGVVVACGIGGLAQTSWSYPTATLTTGAVTSSTPLTTLYTIVIDTGSSAPANPWAGQGYSFIGVGVGSYSGTTSPVPLP